MMLCAVLAAAQVVVQTLGFGSGGVFSPDGKQVLTTAPGGSALFDVGTGRLLRTFAGHKDTSMHHGFSADGATVYTHLDADLKAWDAATGALLGTVTNPAHLNIGGIGLVAGSTQVVATFEEPSDAPYNPTNPVFDGRTLEPQGTISEKADATWFAATYQDDKDPRNISPDGTLRATKDGLEDAKTRALVRRVERRVRPPTLAAFLGTELATIIEVSPYEPGEEPVLAGVVWDLSTLRPVRSFRVPYGQDQQVVAGRVLAIKLQDFTPGQPLALVDAQSGAVLRKLPMPGTEPAQISFSSDGKRVVSQVSDAPRLTVTVRDAKTGAVLRVVKERANDQGGGMGVAMSPDGSRFAFSSLQGQVKVAELKGEPRTVRVPGMIFSQTMSISPDNRTLAVARSDEKVTLLDMSTGKKLVEVQPVPNPDAGPIRQLLFSPSGKILAVSGPGANVTLWDPRTGKKLGQLAGNGDGDQVAFAPDEKRMVTAGGGTVKLWTTQTGALIATLLATSETDFAVVLPDGMYSASRGALQAVQFTEGMKVFPFESFDLLYNRPDKVLEEAAIAPSKVRIEALRRAHERRLRMMGFASEPVLGELRLPEVKLAGTPPMQTAEAQLKFSVTADGNGAELDRLNVYADDVPAFGSKGQKLSGAHAEQEVSVPLGAGLNHFSVSVLDVRGVESPRVPFDVERTGAPPPRKLLVAAIGVSDYGRPEANLGYAAKDARDLSARLTGLAAAHFAEVKTIVLTDKEATREGVLALREKLLQSDTDDEVVLFVAGHGLLDGKLDWYFGTPDIDFDNPSARGIAWNELEGLLDGIPARRKLLLVDTCFSGEVDKGEVALISAASPEGQVKTRAASTRGLKRIGLGLDGTMDLLREQFADLRHGSGAVVISSAGGAEYALESAEWNNGVFTWSLLSGLAGAADKDKDGQLRVSELRDYVVQKVSALTGGRQKPTARRENLALDFDVY